MEDLWVQCSGHKPPDHSPRCSELGGSEMTLEMTLVFIYLTRTAFLWLQLIRFPSLSDIRERTGSLLWVEGEEEEIHTIY